MRKVEVLIILGAIAVGAGVWTQKPAAPPPPRWQVDGANIYDTPESLERKFGPPQRKQSDKDADQYWFKPDLKVTYWHDTGNVGISGERLQRNDGSVVAMGDSEAKVRQSLGEPTRTRNTDDFRTINYDYACIYLRNDKVFGVVTDGVPDRR